MFLTKSIRHPGASLPLLFSFFPSSYLPWSRCFCYSFYQEISGPVHMSRSWNASSQVGPRPDLPSGDYKPIISSQILRRGWSASKPALGIGTIEPRSSKRFDSVSLLTEIHPLRIVRIVCLPWRRCHFHGVHISNTRWIVKFFIERIIGKGEREREMIHRRRIIPIRALFLRKFIHSDNLRVSFFSKTSSWNYQTGGRNAYFHLFAELHIR